MEKGRISKKQFVILNVMFFLGSSAMILPSYVADAAGRNAWMSAIISILFAVLVVKFYTYIGKRFPNQTIIQYCSTILGPWLGKGVGLLLIIYFFILCAGLLRQAGDFITTEIMPETPIQALIILLLIVIVYGVSLGLEVFARTSEILMPWVYALFILLTFALIPQINIENIQPLLEGGIKPVLKGTYYILSLPVLDLFIFLMIFPYIKEHETMKSTWVKGTLISGSIFLLIMTLNILVIGADVTSMQNYPTYDLGKKVAIGNFLERVEVTVAIIWLISLFIKICISFYVSALGIVQIFNLKNYQSIILPMGFVIVPLSLIVVPNIVSFNEEVTTVWPPYIITIALVIPVFLLIVDVVKKKINAVKGNK